MDLDDGDVEELDRVPDRVAVVRPGAGVDDDAVRPVERVVAPVDELALVIRLTAARRALEPLRPLVDPALELRQPEPAVDRRVPLVEGIQVHPVEDGDAHRATLPR